ncbi:MAG: hypothetical protein K2W96_24260 [Gemmataceae bacterium]|nr:hypothetical protein [Gemmataceae bacterium]
MANVTYYPLQKMFDVWTISGKCNLVASLLTAELHDSAAPDSRRLGFGRLSKITDDENNWIVDFHGSGSGIDLIPSATKQGWLKLVFQLHEGGLLIPDPRRLLFDEAAAAAPAKVAVAAKGEKMAVPDINTRIINPPPGGTAEARTTILPNGITWGDITSAPDTLVTDQAQTYLRKTDGTQKPRQSFNWMNVPTNTQWRIVWGNLQVGEDLELQVTFANDGNDTRQYLKCRSL